MVKAKYWKTIITTKIEPPKTLTTYFHAFVAPPRGMVIFKIMHEILKIQVWGRFSLNLPFLNIPSKALTILFSS
jgi:hypothetical protein